MRTKSGIMLLRASEHAADRPRRERRQPGAPAPAGIKRAIFLAGHAREAFRAMIFATGLASARAVDALRAMIIVYERRDFLLRG